MLYLNYYGGISSTAERFTVDEEVVGSKPISHPLFGELLITTRHFCELRTNKWSIPIEEFFPLSNLINPDNAGKRRDRYVKATVLAMRELVGKKKVDDEVRDLTAFIVLTLKQIDETIDETCKAWEKRDYWIKADRFRNDWFWTKSAESKLEQAVIENKWQLVPAVVKDMAKHLQDVAVPKRDWGTPWTGADALLLEKRQKEAARR